MPVSGATTYKLKDITVDGMIYGQDIIQTLSPDTTVSDGMYAYVSKAFADQMAADQGLPPGTYDAMVGWWDMLKGGAGVPGAEAGDVDIKVGTGFLGQFLSLANAKVTSAGSAPLALTSIFTEGKSSPFISCYIPRTIKLKDITVNNMIYGQDIIQTLDPTTTVSDGMYAYVSKAFADQMAADQGLPPGTYDAMVGWWDMLKGGAGVPGAEAGEVDVNPGDAFLGQVLSLSNLEFVFPSSIPAAE